MERPSPDELISAYVDDETSPEESAVVERLLADTKSRQRHDDYRQIGAELRSLPASAMSEAWNQRLRDRIAAERPGWSAPESTSGSSDVSLPATRGGDGFAPYRRLWLTVGVGVAAGTLGIVIGWSAQIFGERGAFSEVALSPQASTATGWAAISNDVERSRLSFDASDAMLSDLEAGAVAVEEQSAALPTSTLSARVEDETAQKNADLAFSNRNQGGPSGASRSFAESDVWSEPAGTYDGAATYADGKSDGERARRLEDLASSDRSGSEEVDVTYVAMWDVPNGRFRGSSFRQRSNVEELPAAEPLADERALTSSAPAISSPSSETKEVSLVLEGSPAQVAEALEALAGADSTIRLLRRTAGANDAPSPAVRLSETSRNGVAADDGYRRSQSPGVTPVVEGELGKYAAPGEPPLDRLAYEPTSGLAELEAFFFGQTASAYGEGPPSQNRARFAESGLAGSERGYSGGAPIGGEAGSGSALGGYSYGPPTSGTPFGGAAGPPSIASAAGSLPGGGLGGGGFGSTRSMTPAPSNARDADRPAPAAVAWAVPPAPMNAPAAPAPAMTAPPSAAASRDAPSSAAPGTDSVAGAFTVPPAPAPADSASGARTTPADPESQSSPESAEKAMQLEEAPSESANEPQAERSDEAKKAEAKDEAPMDRLSRESGDDKLEGSTLRLEPGELDESRGIDLRKTIERPPGVRVRVVLYRSDSLAPLRRELAAPELAAPKADAAETQAGGVESNDDAPLPAAPASPDR